MHSCVRINGLTTQPEHSNTTQYRQVVLTLNYDKLFIFREMRLNSKSTPTFATAMFHSSLSSAVNQK